MVVVIWLSLLHKDLPKLIKQRYSTQLRSHSLASVKDEISGALDSLLEEIQNNQDSRVLHSVVRSRDNNDRSSRFRGDNDRDRRGDNERDRRGDNDRDRRTARSNRECVICKSSGRQYRDHFFSDCRFLPEGDRRYISTLRARAGNVESDDEIDEEDEHYIESTGSSARSDATGQDQNIDVSISARRVPVVSSPFINSVFHDTIYIFSMCICTSI